MKKVYETPSVYIETFEFSEHIAACGETNRTDGNNFGRPNSKNIVECEFVSNDSVLILFNRSSNADCSEDYSDGWEEVVGCYNLPTEDNSIFAS